MDLTLTIKSDSASEIAEVTQALAGRRAPAHEWVWRTGQLTRCARCGVFIEVAVEPCAGKPEDAAAAGCSKPARVEARQRWRVDFRDIDGAMTDHTVDVASDREAKLLGDDGCVRFKSTSEMLTSLRWSFLGYAPTSPAPQDPKRDGEAEASAPAVEGPSEPTARDAVAGMLLRYGYTLSACELAHGRLDIEHAAQVIRREPVSDEDRACIDALEALTRGDLRGARDHQDLLAAIERLTSERDQARRANVFHLNTIKGAKERLGAEENEGLWLAAERVEAVIAEVISEPPDGELRARPAALRVLRLVEEFLKGGAPRADGALADGLTGLDAGGGP